MRFIARIFRIELLYVYATVILAGGFVAYLINASAVPAGTLIVRSYGIQSLAETFAYIFLVVMGVIGFLLILRAGEQQKNPRESALFFFVGFMLVIIAFSMIFAFWGYKFG